MIEKDLNKEKHKISDLKQSRRVLKTIKSTKTVLRRWLGSCIKVS